MKTKLKQKNGITLIALIITIIILLILAMVTIRILMNQGIIKHAENATAAYNNAQNNETEYLTYAEGEMDKYARGYETGNSEQSSNAVPDLLQKYVLGSEGTGRPDEEILDFDSYQFFDESTSITDASSSVKYLNEMSGAMYIKYNNAAYKITLKSNVTQKVEKVYEPKAGTKEGAIVKYSADGSETKTDWLVLYDNGSTLDIISVDTMGSLTLGSGDISATNDINDSDADVGKAINSYNNMYSRINNYCKSLVTNITAQNVRSVGSKPDYSMTDTIGTYGSTTLSVFEGKYNNVGKVEDTNAESDIIRMSFYDEESFPFGYAKSNEEYWLASRATSEFSGGRWEEVDFHVRYVDCDGMAAYITSLWEVVVWRVNDPSRRSRC